MGILSRLGLRRSADEPERAHSLIRDRYEDPRIAEAERGAAEDIAAVEQDDRYFDLDAPAQKDEGI